VELCGFTPNVLMPSIARDVWDLGPEGLGILNAFSAAGGIIAIALISFVGNIRYQGIAFIVVLHVFGIAIMLLGFAPSVYIAIVAIVVLSGMMALSDLFSQTLMQRLVPNDLRGRIMGAWATAIGISPVGNLEIGALASLLGITMALTFHGGALLLLAVVTLATFGKLRRI
jgi:ENTS family enterobactin (siderophore) exporter